VINLKTHVIICLYASAHPVVRTGGIKFFVVRPSVPKYARTCTTVFLDGPAIDFSVKTLILSAACYGFRVFRYFLCS